MSFGVKALVASFSDGTSLTTHANCISLKEVPPSHQRPIQKFISSLNDALDRTSQILITLHGKESLLEYLADVPMKLMPDVVSSIPRERNQIQSMSMV